MALPSFNQITNLYLYGQNTRPANLTQESLIRSFPPAEKDRILYDAVVHNIPSVDLMNPVSGPGRFALGAQFSLIDKFFTYPQALLNPTGAAEMIYDKYQIGFMVGLLTGEVSNPQGDIGFNMTQKDWRDGYNDYAERTYIYNSMRFQIGANAQFVVKANGERWI